MDRGELHRPLPPRDVLHVRRVLGPEPPWVLAQRPPRPVEEHLAEGVEPLGGRVAAVAGTMAVGPLIVARGVDQRILELVEAGPDLLEVGGVAERGAVLDVAEVDDQADVGIGIDLGDVVREVVDLRLPVGMSPMMA
jgi:hypothetical protein